MRVKVIKIDLTLNIHTVQYLLNKTSGFESFCKLFRFMVSYILKLFSQVQYWHDDRQGPK